MKIKQGTLCWFLAAGVLGGYMSWLTVSGSFNIESNVLELLPANQADPAINQAFESFSESNMRQLVLLIENSNLESAKTDAQLLVTTLSDSEWIAEVTATVSAADQSEVTQLVYQYRHHLLSLSDAELLRAGNFDEFSADTLQRVFSPLSGNLAALVPTDPFLLSFRFVASNEPVGLQSMTLDDDYLIAQVNGNYYVLVTAQLDQSPFSPVIHSDLLGRFAEVESQWKSMGSSSALLRTGALFYTADAYSTAQFETSRFGGASLVLVLFLVMLVFRNPQPLLMVALTVGFGICAGFAVVRFVFGEVHLLTLVFGASLIGVAVDYAFHYFAVGESTEGRTRLQAIFPAITLGLTSSVIGYTALLSTPFPGLRQMAVFCIVGLAGAYSTVVWIYPLVPLRASRNEAILKACRWFLQRCASPWARNIWRLLLLTPVAAILLLISVDYQSEDIREFQATNTELERQEEQIGSVLDNPAANQFYLVRGSSAEAMLQQLEAVLVELDGLVTEGVIDSYLSVHPWLPSLARQRDNYDLYSQLYASSAADSLMSAGLLNEQEYTQVQAAFAFDEEAYLLPEPWLESVLGSQYAALWLDPVDGEHFTVVAIRGINDLEALQDLNPNVIFVDQVSTVSELLVSYRRIASFLLMLASALILVLLSWRFGFRHAARVLSSPLIAISVTVMTIQVVIGSVNLFNILALFLVLGIGIDFGIFFAEAGRPRPGTLLAVLLSALTTMFSFGMLSLSSTPMIQSFGLSMLIGIGTVFLLAPIVGNMVATSGPRIHESYST